MSQIAASLGFRKCISIFNSVLQRRRERAQLRQMLYMNDQMLSDIGLLRSDIHTALGERSRGVGTAYLNAVVEMRHAQRVNQSGNDNRSKAAAFSRAA